MVRLIETRKTGPSEENSWTFGQILPLVLLAAPIVTVIEHFGDTSSVQTNPRSALMPPASVCVYPTPIRISP